MVCLKRNLNKVFVVFVIFVLLNCSLANLMNDFNECLEVMDALFGLHTTPLECAKKIILSTTLWTESDSMYKIVHKKKMNEEKTKITIKMRDERSYAFRLKNSLTNCDDILLPEDFCGKRVYAAQHIGADSIKSGTPQTGLKKKIQTRDIEIYEKCVDETKVFKRESKLNICKDAFGNHALGDNNSAHPGHIYQPGSHGEAYLKHIAENIKLEEMYNPEQFCHMLYDVSYPVE